MKEWDYSRRDQKIKELEKQVSDYLIEVGVNESSELAKQIIDSFAKVTPPEKEQRVLHLITMADISGRNGGKSLKLGNVRLNMRNLIDAISAGVFTTLSVNDQKWAIPFAAVMLWNSLWKNLQVDLTPTEVVVLVTLHKIAVNRLVNIDKNDLLSRVNQRMDMYEMLHITKKDLEFALQQLAAINSVELNRDGSIFAKEWIQLGYR